MNEVLIAVFSMKGCSHCAHFKEMLEESNVKYSELDIEEYPDEYEMFVEKTGGNEFVPSFMVIEIIDNKNKFHYYAPERDYNELEDAIKIIKKHRRKINL